VTNEGTAARDDVERMRAAFFQRTRRHVAILYVVLALMAIGAGAYAFATAWEPAVVGVAVGFVAGVVAFLLSPKFPTSANAARKLVVAAPIAGLVAGTLFFDSLSQGWQAGVVGFFAGYLAAAIVGMASIRRRLAHDDELLLRQKSLGFDPEKPWGWLRRSS
jgi:membrane associated rhomboid family serine protease